MRIFIAQTRIKAAAPDANFKCIEEALALARRESADLIVFPEMALPGYFIGDAWERPSFLARCEELNHRIASLSWDAPVIFGSVGIDPSARNEDGRIRKFNAAFIAQNGKLLQNPALTLPFWPKTLMPNYREFDDSRHFYDLRKLALERGVPLQSLLKLIPLTLAGGRTIQIALGICEDAWSDDYSAHPYDILAATGQPDLIVNISCSPFTAGKHSRRKKLFGKIASQKNCPLIYVNGTGTQNLGKTIFTFDGDSGIYHSNQFCPVGPSFAAVCRTLDLGSLKATATSDAKPGRIVELHGALESAMTFIKEEWKLERVVVGVSGGIDSALSAVLHARIFGPENVFCLNMPSQFNSQLTIGAAEKLAKNLGCKFASAGIDDAVKLTLRQLDDVRTQGFPISDPLHSLVRENIQARDRGARLLAGTASAMGAVFPCNANKTETTVGYSTLYGDHAGYMAPLADLWKQDVYELARHYNTSVFCRTVVPDESLSVIPSAELSADQDVTQGKGDPLCYPYHDALFRLWVEEWNRFSFESTLKAWDDGSLTGLIGNDAARHMQRLFKTREDFVTDLSRWWTAYSGMAAFKRVQAPPVLALTRRAFGFDHREAIGLPSFTGQNIQPTR
jgi:NAD+ synthase (glutamine-hydrolysing)